MKRAFHFYHALQRWHPERDERQWVLGTVYRVQGSAYRKPGAQMLFNDLGQQLGVLSGGCLEADLQTRARRVMQTGQPETVRYDSLDDDALDNSQGLGCGGIVDILLQQVHSKNNYLYLNRLLETLQLQQQAVYTQQINFDGDSGNLQLNETVSPATNTQPTNFQTRCRSEETVDGLALKTTISRPPQLLVVGGGVDAIPLVVMADELGWQVTVSDPRPANARREDFPNAARLDRTLCQRDANGNINTPRGDHWLRDIDAAVVMGHSQSIDATALLQLRSSNIRYLALLGPRHRKQRVLEQAGITDSDLPCELQGPAGLPIGGELPASIALSILAQCHSALYNSGNK